MTTTGILSRVRRLMRDLRTANGANVTITFALATVPIVGFVGAAVDYSHANSVKTALQAATDATALMLSKTADKLTNAQLQTQAFTYLQALFTRPEATGLTVTATYTKTAGSQVTVVSNANVKANFMSFIGTSSMKVAADSQVKWGNVRMRVALALDTTGSMAQDGKIDALKTATKGLLDQLKDAAVNNGDVYVSIIPFSKDVNIGKSNYAANWIDWTDWDDDNGDDVSTTKCTKKGKKTKCTTSSSWVPDNHNTWNGCVTDRGKAQNPNKDYDVNVAAPTTSDTSSLFPAEQFDDCSPPIKTLSYDWAGMKTLVDSFYPAGMTNQNIGLAHAWMSLVGGGPYPAPPAKDPAYTYQDVIILMTDGLNTQNRWYDQDQSDKIDERQKKTCDNINAAGVQLYTIQVNTGGDPTSTLLKSCAGSKGKYPDADKFFLLTSANQMVETFKAIGTKLSNLRIAQ